MPNTIVSSAARAIALEEETGPLVGKRERPLGSTIPHFSRYLSWDRTQSAMEWYGPFSLRPLGVMSRKRYSEPMSQAQRFVRRIIEETDGRHNRCDAEGNASANIACSEKICRTKTYIYAELHQKPSGRRLRQFGQKRVSLPDDSVN